MTRALQVLHVYKDIFPPIAGGIEKHIDSIRRSLPGDIANDVLVCSRERRTVKRAVGGHSEVKVAELGRALSVPLAPTFPLWLRRAEADIVHVHSPNPLGELSVLLGKRQVPLVLSHHADIVRQARYLSVYQPLVDACMQRADRILVGSHAMKRSSPFLRAVQEKVSVLPYPVDTDVYSDSARVRAQADAVRDRYGTPLVVALGRLVYYKGYDVLIAAAAAIHGNVLIIGSGPLEAELRQAASGLNNVQFAGYVAESELPGYLAAATCFVQPSTSRAESFGIATVEAQAMGVPAVVTDVGTGTVETVAPDVTGYVVGPGDPAALASRVNDVLDDRPRADRMGREATKRAREHNGRSRYAEQLAAIYRSLTN